MATVSSANWTLKDDIREYWSSRAATFDLSPGHEIFTDEERAAWQALFRRHLGDGSGRTALDLASGTGVISRLLHEIGFRVTGLDFAEPMLERARRKAADLGLPARFRIGDAENTLEPDASHDVIVTRHLVWTLPDPAAAFADWLRVLKPGGRILIVDVDMVRRTLSARAFGAAARLLARFAPPRAQPGVDRAQHDRIVAQVYFRNGAQAEEIAELLALTGFVDVGIDRNLGAIRRGQGRVMPLHQRLDRASQDRYAVHARKPAPERRG
jgi:ubiquinone/menaquinone biosynthesis C-methylase UbiE